METIKLDKALKKESLSYVDVELFENDIMRFTFTQNVFVTMQMALELTDLARKMCPNTIYRSLKVLHFKMQLEDEVTKYLSGNARKDMVKVEAFVITSTPLRFFANFFMRVKKPTIKSKVFMNEEEAVKWLLAN